MLDTDELYALGAGTQGDKAKEAASCTVTEQPMATKMQ
jgi:hypothetical protein